MNVTLYKYSGNVKRLRKTLDSSTSIPLTNVYLKDGTSVTQPSILVTTSTNLSGYNYCYIQEFSRYYFFEVDSVSNGVWDLKCSVDVLYTYHIDIESNSGYIERASTGYSNKIVDDAESFENYNEVYYANLSADVQGDQKTLNLNQTLTNQSTNVTISVVNDLGVQPIVADGSKEVSYNAPITSMSKNYFPIITGQSYYNYVYLSYMLAMENIKTIYQDNVASFIKSIVVWPFTLDELPQSGETPFGPYKLRLGSTDYGNAQFGLPKYTAFGWMCFFDYIFDSLTYYYQYEPYTTYELYIPYVGWRKINIEDVSGKRVILTMRLNYESGKAQILMINYTDGYIISSYNAQIGCVVPISRSNLESLNAQAISNGISMTLGVLGGAVSTTLGVASGNPIAIASGIMGATSAIAKGVSSNIGMFEQGQAQIRDGFTGLDCRNVILKRTIRKRVVTDLTAQMGKPVHKVASLGSFSGFVKAKINRLEGVIGASKWEQDEIIRLFSEGVICGT